MLEQITAKNIGNLRSSAFRQYAQRYLDIQSGFCEQVATFGLPFGNTTSSESLKATLDALKEKGATIRNNGASVVTSRLSPGCADCITCEHSRTYYLSLKCHRNCYFCFNPNQVGFEEHWHSKRDVIAELRAAKEHGDDLTCIALSGGEPLLFPEDAIAFFKTASALYPNAHLRLYTSGDLLTEDMLRSLKDAGLREIRFSVKLDDARELRARVLSNMEKAVKVLPSVMVEMPVAPNTLAEMKELLETLQSIGVQAINLLEFCFPFNNPEEYARRGFAIKNPPYRIFYNYSYAGGLPLAQSEEEALALVAYALDNKFEMGVHYCSLENKFSAQVWSQNAQFVDDELTIKSKRDFFIKTAKVFGEDAKLARRELDKLGLPYEMNDDYGFLQMNPYDVLQLKHVDIEVGISYQITEVRDGETLYIELAIDRSASTLLCDVDI